MDARKLATAGVHAADLDLDQLQVRLDRARDLFFLRKLISTLRDQRASAAALRIHLAAESKLSREISTTTRDGRVHGKQSQ